MISEKRLKEVALVYFRNNQDDIKTAQILNLKPSAVRRYIRKFRENPSDTTPSKIFIADIETAQMIVKVWSLRQYGKYIDYRRIVKDWFILMWSGKWALSNEVLGECVTPKEALDRDDSRILEPLWDILDNAQIVIGHNYRSFDDRKIKARLFKHKQLPPSSYQIIDTLKHSQKEFALSSHKLDYITGYLELPQKLETNIGLWDNCEDGSQDALDEMFEYCKNDIVINEQLYFELLPWMKSHPNVGLFTDMTEECCPNCGSTNLEHLDKFYITPVNKFPVVRCLDCGKPSHSRTSTVSPKQRKNLLRSSAK